MSKIISIIIVVIVIFSLSLKRRVIIETSMCPLKIEMSKDYAVVASNTTTRASLTASPVSWERQRDDIDSSQLMLIVIDEIVRQCEENNFSIEVALAIAKCESGFNPNAKNPSSSARGVYQWLSGSWDYIKAEGHPFDYKENIKQFIKWYPQYPNWWQECLDKI